jgi:hypothetical protein
MKILASDIAPATFPRSKTIVDYRQLLISVKAPFELLNGLFMILKKN